MKAGKRCFFVSEPALGNLALVARKVGCKELPISLDIRFVKER